MSDARWWRACIALSSASLIPVSSFVGDHGINGFYQHGGMAAMAETPAGAGVNRERALMVPAMNGTIGSKALPTLYNIAQVAGRQPVDHFSLPGHL